MATPKHGNFGGDWTEEKLARLAKYLPAYAYILKDKSYKYACIDAFAGPGYRARPRKQAAQIEDLWGEDPDERAKRFTAGSAVVAMRSEPPFQTYIFIEQDVAALRKLEGALRKDFPQRIQLAKFESGDANVVLKRLCARDWSKHRAVLFLDPYGMEVEWSTMEAIARTQAIDVWILFPAGIGVNRQLPADGNVPAWARTTFDRLFGTPEWYDRFYAQHAMDDMFGGPARVQKTGSPDEIVAYYRERLESIFPHVAPSPLVLCNSNNAAMFALFFAAAHPKYGATAVKIAQDVLKAYAWLNHQSSGLSPHGTRLPVVPTPARGVKTATPGEWRGASRRWARTAIGTGSRSPCSRKCWIGRCNGADLSGSSSIP